MKEMIARIGVSHTDSDSLYSQTTEAALNTSEFIKNSKTFNQ